MRQLLILAAMGTTTTFVVQAQGEPPARIFLQEVNGSFGKCVRLIGEGDMRDRLYGRSAPITAGSVGDCANAGRARVRRAYDAYVATGPSDEARASAKELYAASLAYAEAIAAASSFQSIEGSAAQADLSKARSHFVIDSGL